VTQSPIEGHSFAHVFKDSNAESRHKTQYFEMFAHRSIYSDGWRAVCPVPGTSFTESGISFGMLTLTEDKLRELDANAWELYDLSKDPTETTNLAESNRPKLIEMIALWYTEAGKYNVLPLDSRGTLRFADERPELTEDRQTYVYYPHTQLVPENVAAKLLNRSHSLTAEVEIPKGGAEGVLICHGGNVGGYTLFVKDKKLQYVHNYVGAEEFHLVSNIDVPEGKAELRYEFEATGKPDLKAGKGSPGKGQLYINKKLVGEMSLPYTVPLALGIGSGIVVGRNAGSSVTSLYGPPFEFTGTIFQVTVDISGKLFADSEEEGHARAKVAMARQ
jgi:arylsulfatase